MSSYVSRRSVLWLAAGAAAPLLRLRVATAAEKTHPMLSWSDFTSRRPDLLELAGDPSAAGVDAYLYSVAALAVRLADVPAGKLSSYKLRAPLVSFAPIHRGVPFFVIEWRMEPGGVLPPHNHPGYSVCTVGLEGEARIRHYEPAPDAPPLTSREPFHVRLTREQVLVARSVSTLGPDRDNLHTFTAGPRGAHGIDITTLHAAADSGFSFAEIAEKQGASDQFVARWI